VRGLKSKCFLEIAKLFWVAPYIGAWIEIEKMWELNTPYNVAPNIGAWIEMATLPLMKVFYQRRTLHRCVD
jgi:hypothetical protein